MSLYSGPEQHAKNPPSTWTVQREQVGSHVSWFMQDAEGNQIGHRFSTKKAATAALTDGHEARLWEKERRWYAGENVHPWKPWSVVKAENEARDRRNAERKQAERRKIERMGTTPERVGQWREDVASEHLGKVTAAAEEMLELLIGAGRFGQPELLNPDLLNRAEAAELRRELGESHDLASSVEDQIHRIAYLGLDTDLSTLEVLEKLRQHEREAAEDAAVLA